MGSDGAIANTVLFRVYCPPQTNLKNFNSTSKLKQATCSLIASQLLLKKEKEEIDDVFRALNTNCDGMLTKDEVKNGYFDYYGKRLTDEEVDKMFANINHAGTGVISYSEFVVASMAEKNLIDNSRLEAAFAMFDSDGDGVISVENFKQVLSFFKEEAEGDENIDEYIFNKIIKQVDADGDGKISYLDFQQMMIATVAEENPPDLPSPPVPAPKPSGHHRIKSAILDVGNAAEPYMSMFAEAAMMPDASATSALPVKRHHRNLSHLALFANPESLPDDAILPAPTHKRINYSMSMLSKTSELSDTLMQEDMSERSSSMLEDMSDKSSSKGESSVKCKSVDV